jgi:hypothetical protein
MIPYPGIGLSVVIIVRTVIGIPYGMVVLPVGTVVHQAEADGRPGKIAVERPVYIIPVVGIDITGVIVIKSPVVIKDPHASQPVQPTVAVVYINIPDLVYPAIVIIIYRHIFHLDHGAVVVILYKRIIIITRVKGDVRIPRTDTYSGYPVINIEIELPIGIY